MKETPRTSPLSVPIAKDKTNKNSNEEISGEKSVCAQTFIKPNLLVPILYFFVISTIDSLITPILKKLCKTKSTNSLNAF